MATNTAHHVSTRPQQKQSTKTMRANYAQTLESDEVCSRTYLHASSADHQSANFCLHAVTLIKIKIHVAMSHATASNQMTKMLNWLLRPLLPNAPNCRRQAYA